MKKSKRARSTVAPRNMDCSLRDAFHTLKTKTIFTYDTARYPFRETVAAGLGVDPGTLATLNHLPSGKDLPDSTEATLALKALYDDFVCNVIAPQIDAILPCGGTVVYQSLPCMRIHPGNSAALGPRHKDSDYEHQEGQINFWLPLVTVSGPNTLYVETGEGTGVFEPLEMIYGQVARFYGNGCEHYTVANTSCVTRVSFDFRVVPGPCYDSEHPSCKKFFVGPTSYYALATVPSETQSGDKEMRERYPSWRFVPRTAFEVKNRSTMGLTRKSRRELPAGNLKT